MGWFVSCLLCSRFYQPMRMELWVDRSPPIFFFISTCHFHIYLPSFCSYLCALMHKFLCTFCSVHHCKSFLCSLKTFKAFKDAFALFFAYILIMSVLAHYCVSASNLHHLCDIWHVSLLSGISLTCAMWLWLIGFVLIIIIIFLE